MEASGRGQPGAFTLGVRGLCPQLSECVKATERRVLPRTHTQASNSPSPVLTKFPV